MGGFSKFEFDPIPSFRFECLALNHRRGGRRLFSDYCLRFEGGELIKVLGGNGAGKSTLLQLMVGLLEPEQGSLLFNGEALSGFRGHCFYLGHTLGLKGGLTAFENLYFDASEGGCAREAGEKALNYFGLLPFADTLLRRLSRGQRQRIALARLLLTRASLWVLDEPFSGLDKENVLRFEHLLQAGLVAGRSIVLATHRESVMSGFGRVEVLQ